MKNPEVWIDKPTKGGKYWMSPLIEGKHVFPRIIQVIDYDGEGRSLEVEYDLHGDTIPIDLFLKEYCPKAKWLFIEVPNWQALVQR